MFLFVSFFYITIQNVFAQSWGAQGLHGVYYLNGVSSGGANQACAVGLSGVIVTTNDGGTTWTTQTTGITTNMWGVSFVSPTRGWAAGNSGKILTTSDGGTTWTTQTSATASNLYAVYFVDANYGWAVGNQGKVEATTNGGSTWTLQTSNLTLSPPPIRAIPALQGVYFTSSTQGWAVGGSGSIIATTDGGATWAIQTSGTTSALTSVYFVNATTGWAVGGSGTILTTSNGGSTWTRQTSGTTNSLTSVYFYSATQGWAVGSSGTILTTNNGGVTWVSQTSGTSTSIQGVRFTSTGQGFAVLYGSATMLSYTLPTTSITSITANSAYSNASSVNYTVTFEAAVTGVTAGNFSLSSAGVSGASVGTPTTSDNITWTVPVNTGTGDGTIGLNLANATGLSLAISTSLPFSGGITTIDKTAPALSISSPSVTTTSTGPVSYTLTYADANFNSATPVTGDITLNTTGTANGTVGVSGSGTSRTVTISGITGVGTLGISVASGTASDRAGNSASATAPSATFAVTLIDQHITFNALPVKTYGDADFSPDATSDNNGIPVTYSSDNTAVATIVNGEIHVLGAGAANITASQAGDDTHAAAAGAIQLLTVNKAPLTITAADQAKLYGASLPVLTASYGGFVNGDTESSLTTLPTVSTTATAASHVSDGPYIITANEAVSANYTISYVAGTLTLNAASLTITADDQVKTYGAAIPELTASYAGFVNGDTQGSLTALPAISTIATAGSQVSGSPYVITASGAVDSDYNISYVTGGLTVNTAPLTITANDQVKDYGAAIPDLTASYSGFVNGDTQASLATLPTISTTATAASHVSGGPYAITINGAAGTNYTISYVAGVLTVNPTSLTITANDQTKTYGAAIPALTASYTGFANGDTPADLATLPTLSTTATASSPLAGNPYAITASGAADPDYNISYVSGTLTVTAASDATLSRLSSTAGGLNPVFNSSVSGYMITVPNGIATITVTPTAADINATIQVRVNGGSYSPVSSGAASGSLALNPGDNPIDILVTAQNGTTTTNYTIIVTRALLTNALLSTITFDPYIKATTVSGPDYKDYTGSVSNAVSSMTVKPVTQDPTATVTVNGVAVASGASSTAIPLSIGANIINTVVTAQNGITTKTYSITVIRQGNALLRSLTFSPQLATATVAGPNYKNYTATVNSAITTVQITPVAEDPTSTIKVNDIAVASGATSDPIALNIGANTINTVVTAADGTTTKTYSLVITRTYSTLLTSLKVNPFTPVTTVSGPDYKDYTASVKNTVSTISVTAVTQDPTSTIKVNGVIVASGTASTAIPLNVGNNTVTTVVTAADGMTSRTYSIVITRGVNALLASLTFSPRITITTVAGPDFKDYTATVANTTSSVKVTPVTQDATSTVTVNNLTVASGTATSIPLNVGDNTIATIVTAQDGTTTNTYNTVITRLAPSGSASLYDEKLVAVAPVRNTDIVVHQNVSPNGDGNSDVLLIDGITTYPDNTLQIMSRNGQLVYEAKGYDNVTKVFDGHAGNGKLQQAGTYFYSLEYKVGTETKHKTGYLVLRY